MRTIFDDADRFDRELQEAGDRWDRGVFGRKTAVEPEEPAKEELEEEDDDEDDDEVED